jgi:hypothetical protein
VSLHPSSALARRRRCVPTTRSTAR